MIAKYRSLIFCLAILLVPSSLAFANKTKHIEHWLDRMAHASEALSYKGRFIHEVDSETSLLEIVHVVADKGSRERIVSLSGEPQELIRDQHGNVFLMDFKQPLLIDKNVHEVSLAVRLKQNLSNVLKNYRFNFDKVDRVAGRKSQVFSIVPLDMQRYSYRLWVDDETGFLIRSQLINEKGKVLEHIMFSDIEIMKTPNNSLLQAVRYSDEFDVNSSRSDIPDNSNKVNQIDAWHITGKPSGFWQVNHNPNMLLGAKKSVIYLSLTDGLASVSVYIEPLKQPVKKMLSGVSRSGALSAFGRVIDHHQITVVGEVPPTTVEEIGNAVTRATVSLSTKGE